MGDADDERSAQLAALLVQHRGRLAAYAFAILRDATAVDDALQEVAMQLLRKRDEWEPARAFLPWALAFTRREALSQRRRSQRGGVAIPPEALDRIEALIADEDRDLALRKAALAGCMAQVGASAAALLRQKYIDGLSAEAIAERSGATKGAINSKLQRLRGSLARCMERRLATEAAT